MPNRGLVPNADVVAARVGGHPPGRPRRDTGATTSAALGDTRRRESLSSSLSGTLSVIVFSPIENTPTRLAKEKQAMQRTRFSKHVIWIIVGLGLYAAVFVWARAQEDLRSLASVMETLIPILLGIAVAWLGFVFNSRISFVIALRQLWPVLVSAIQETIQYTHLKKPKEEDFARVNQSLSTAIDEVRALFANIGEGTAIWGRGLYPFEDLKSIQDQVSTLNPDKGMPTGTTRIVVRSCIVDAWKRFRDSILPEFDRA